MSRTPLSLIIYYLDYLFNYIIKIYGNKIEHQLKNKNLFEIVITLNKKKIRAVYFSTNPILKD
jgi:hypothetical protein